PGAGLALAGTGRRAAACSIPPGPARKRPAVRKSPGRAQTAHASSCGLGIRFAWATEEAPMRRALCVLLLLAGACGSNQNEANQRGVGAECGMTSDCTTSGE